ncbi:carbohydrate kinase family protein [bacterium]|nr:carbohydrate kinase family protein [bacterium]
MKQASLLVIGQLHMELSIDRTRRRGDEEQLVWHDGGQGGHLAVAAARLGALVSLLASAGLHDDESDLLHMLASDGVRVDCVARRSPETFRRHLRAERHGDDQPIALYAPPHSTLCAADLDAAEALFLDHEWLLVDATLPEDVLEEATERAALYGMPAVLSLPHPSPERIPRRVWKRVSYLATNQSSLEALARVSQWPRGMLDDGSAMCGDLGIQGMLVVRGTRDMVVADRHHCRVLPLAPRTVIDARGVCAMTGAALAVGLAEGLPFYDAALLAQKSAQFYLSHEGARAAMPFRLELH